MDSRRLVVLLLGTWLWILPTSAQEQRTTTLKLTHQKALELARKRAPALLAARARVREARSQVDASTVWPFNPRISGQAGPRFGSDETVVDWAVSAQQWLELGGQIGDREQAARAGVHASEARNEDARRIVLRNVGRTFASALYWQQRTDIAERNLRIAEAVARVAKRRHELGDVGGLDESVSALAVVRAQTARERAKISLAQTRAQLKAMLGVAPTTALRCEGDLRRLGASDVARAKMSKQKLTERPDLRALEAEIEQASAQADLGRAAAIPNVALGARYASEEGEDIVQGLLMIELPLFDHGQATTKVAEARRARLRAERRALSQGASVEADTFSITSARLDAAVRVFEGQGLPMLERSEKASTKSYEAGAIPLGELLVMRRELIQARVDHVDLLFAAALARIELAASQGAYP